MGTVCVAAKMWQALVALATFVSCSSGFTSPLLVPLGIPSLIDSSTCPAPMGNFELAEFLEKWYIAEYEFVADTKMKPLDCLGFTYTINDLNDVMNATFSFRFPPSTGFTYNIATFGTISQESKAMWTTKYNKNMEMVSVIVDTDYSRWAVLAQCVMNSNGYPEFQSSRILSRYRDLEPADLERARESIRSAGVGGDY